MSRREATGGRLLLRLAGRPESFATLSLADWDLVLRPAMRAGILARFCFQLAEIGALDTVPERPRRRPESAPVLALTHQRDARRDVVFVRPSPAPPGLSNDRKHLW